MDLRAEWIAATCAGKIWSPLSSTSTRLPAVSEALVYASMVVANAGSLIAIWGTSSGGRTCAHAVSTTSTVHADAATDRRSRVIVIVYGRIRASAEQCGRKLRVLFRAAARAPVARMGRLRVRTTGSGTI